MSELATVDHAHEVHETHEAHPTVTGVSNEKLGMWMFLGSECLMFGGLISTYLLYKNRVGSVAGATASPFRPSSFFDIPFTSVSSFVLLASSMTMVMAVTSAARHDGPRLRLWLATTAALGSIFIGGQVYEFTGFVHEGRTIRTEVMDQHAKWESNAVSRTTPLEVELPSGAKAEVKYVDAGSVSVAVDGGYENIVNPEHIGMGYTSSTASSAFFTMTGFHGVHVTVGIIMLLVLLGLSLKRRLNPGRPEVVEIVGLYWHFVDVVWIVIFTVIYLIK